MIAHNLGECENPEQRQGLLKGMILALEQMADICMNEQLLDSKPGGATRSNPPLSKAAHQ
jgi:hypothetical protein